MMDLQSVVFGVLLGAMLAVLAILAATHSEVIQAAWRGLRRGRDDRGRNDH